MSGIRAGCQRILTTPLPFACTLLLHRFAWLFCVLLPLGLAGALGRATPFVPALLACARCTHWRGSSKSTCSTRPARARCRRRCSRKAVCCTE